MKRSEQNLLIDGVLLLAMVVLSISGMAIYHKEARTLLFELTGWGRGLWRDIHLWAGIATLLLLVLHVLMHRKFITAWAQSRISSPTLRYLLYALLWGLSAVALLPWLWVV